MRTRNVVIGAIVLVVATAAATSFLLGIRGSKSVDSVDVDTALVTVIVSREDIPANQPLDPLVEDGAFEERQIPADLLVAGVVTNLLQVEGSTTVTPILANEQISTARLTSSCWMDYAPPAPFGQLYPFDEREKVVLSLLLEGERIDRIADVLGLSRPRVRGIVRCVDIAIDDR